MHKNEHSFTYQNCLRVFIVLKDAQRIQCSQKHKTLVGKNLVGQKLSTVWGISQGAETPGTQRDIAFSQLAVKAEIFYTEHTIPL
jgi:hypothetical protein